MMLLRYLIAKHNYVEQAVSKWVTINITIAESCNKISDMCEALDTLLHSERASPEGLQEKLSGLLV